MTSQHPSNFSFDERKQAVKNFIVATYQNQIRIRTFHRLAEFLTEDRVKLLRAMEKGHHSEIGRYGMIERSGQWYTDEQAESYFEWLVAVVNETENVGNDVVKQAYDQLFRFLYVMRDDMERAKDVQLVAPYDWQKLFLSFDERLTHMERIIDRGDKEIVEVLKSLHEMVQRNVSLLGILCKESEELFGKNV